MIKNILQGFAVCMILLTSAVSLSGCAVATAVADSKQKPPTTEYTSKQRPDRVFTAAVQAMGLFGKVLSQDRASGVVQGQKGNWIMNAAIVQSGGGSRIQLSARYVPSNQMDFNSRDGMTKEFVAQLEKNLGSKLAEATPLP